MLKFDYTLMQIDSFLGQDMFQKFIFDKMQNRNCLVLYDLSLMGDQALIYHYLETIKKTVDSMSTRPAELNDSLTYPQKLRIDGWRK